MDGGDNIKEVKWEEMSGIIQLVSQLIHLEAKKKNVL